MKRTIYCGLLRESHVGQRHTCCGWVQTKRDMGGVIFIDLKDREGVLQAVFDARNLSPADFKTAEGLKSQSVVALGGPVALRGQETYNPKLATGTVELRADCLEVLSEADPLPFQTEDAREELRLRYRYLDLRRPRMYQNLLLRHRVQKAAQDYLDGEGFLCVETPMLCKSTPEGARDYLVPSRVHPGSFYALPQSPQIFKQLLMVAGVDRYYQVARCFRDEDLRADRQPEFTQVDMELSFVDQEDVLVFLEGLFRRVVRAVTGQEPPAFSRLTWQTAMDRYGTDKPDLRFGLPIADVTEAAGRGGFSVFNKAVAAGGVVRAITVPGGASFTRAHIDALTEKALGYGAKGMAWILIRPDGSVNSILTKYFSPEAFGDFLGELQAGPGDFVLFSADTLAVARRALGGLRLDVADLLGLRAKGELRFLFVTDFPQFEYSEAEKRYVATHHPFTMPYPEDLPLLQTAPEKVRAQAYDVVLNGMELGSGSVRIHNRDVQRAMFQALGFSPEEVEERFGFMVNAFRFGAPPHAGFAFGLDRLVMILAGAESLREVIAFPKNRDAACPMTDAPTPVDPAQLRALGLAAGGPARPAPEAPRLDLENIAHLARLYLAPEEQAAYARDMAAMIEFAGQLSHVDTGGAEAAGYGMPLKNIFRPDTPGPSFPREALLANAPTHKGGYITVPKVVES